MQHKRTLTLRFTIHCIVVIIVCPYLYIICEATFCSKISQIVVYAIEAKRSFSGGALEVCILYI